MAGSAGGAPGEPSAAWSGRARSTVYARHGMVASAHPLATGVGVDVLRAGGSAVDAAVAANAALGFLEPMSCGAGGDLLAILWDPADCAVRALNASGRAPLAIRPEQAPAAPDGSLPPTAPHTWTVPGAVDGWFALHGRYGRLSMADVLAPAAALAREGAPVPRRIAAAWQRESPPLAHLPGFAETYLPAGRAPREGEVFANPRLAGLYDVLAAGGRAAFYDGMVAEAIDAFARRHGGFLRRTDLAAHTSEWVRPLSTTYRGVEVWELPPNSQGITVLELLNVVEALGLGGLGAASPEYWHGLAEATKLAYADRAQHLGDPARIDPDVVARLVSKQHARTLAACVGRTAAELTVAAPAVPAGRDTTVVAAGDESGLLVTLMQSNYDDFGSGHVVDEYGFVLQNRGVQFAVPPGRVNSLTPGARPFHTVAPALVTRGGTPWLAFGVMGGALQPQGQVQVLLNLLDAGLDLQQAGDAPRLYLTDLAEPTGTPGRPRGTLYLEDAVPDPIRAELARRGHDLGAPAEHLFGGYQAVARDAVTGVFAGASESRKDGCAAGW